MLAEQLVNSFHSMMELKTKVIGSDIQYSPDDLLKELRCGILGWIKPNMRIETELNINNDGDYIIINQYMRDLEEITTRQGIPFTEIIAYEGASIPDKPGIVHIVRIR